MNRQSKVLAPMLQILKLTKEGRLVEASAAIRRALKDQPAHAWPGMGSPETASIHSPILTRTPCPRDEFNKTSEEGRSRAGQFITRSFTNEAGSRGYKLYLPQRSSDAMPLLVMMHGCTQTPDDFAAGTRMNELAETHGFIVAYPAQSRSANHANCWNWFKDSRQHQGNREPSIIAGMTIQIAADYAVDRTRIYIAGLSAGGAMASVLAATHPEMFAAVGVHSGLANGSAHDIPSALAAMKRGGTDSPDRARPDQKEAVSRFVPTIVFHGDKDTTVNPANGVRVVAQALQRAPDRVTDTGPVIEHGHADISGRGRSYTRKNYRDEHGLILVEHWIIHGAGHAWSGGSSKGSYADDRGPDASGEMFRFFSAHALKQ